MRLETAATFSKQSAIKQAHTEERYMQQSMHAGKHDSDAVRHNDIVLTAGLNLRQSVSYVSAAVPASDLETQQGQALEVLQCMCQTKDLWNNRLTSFCNKVSAKAVTRVFFSSNNAMVLAYATWIMVRTSSSIMRAVSLL